MHEDLFGSYAVCIDNFVSDCVQGKIDKFNNKNRLNTKKFTPITISEEGLAFIEFLSIACTAQDGDWRFDSEIKIDKNGYVIVNGEKTKDFWDGRILCKEKPLRLKIRNIYSDETVWDV